jgi:hypothetical protein
MPLLGPRRGPGIVRGVARTAVVAGTATAVSGRVARRQAERFGEQDAAMAQQAAPAPPAAPSSDTASQLKEIAQMKADGILSDEEFAAAKAKILGG